MVSITPMLDAVTLAIVLLVGLYFVTLGAMSLFAPAKAKTFLLGFATSAFKHYLELTLRLIVGGSLLLQAPHFTYPNVFTLFGWLLIGTTACLLLIPWKVHRRFAEKAVPLAIACLPVIGVTSFVLGIVLLGCLLNRLVRE